MRSGDNLEGRFDLGMVYRELRRVASAGHLPIWTASQATREASRTGLFRGSDIAEDISKLHTADIAICLNQTDSQKDDERMTLVLDKSRISLGMPDLVVSMDFQTMTMKELNG